ncbi:SMP-30/gluconolactonase/LRE family protein [Mucilaginibacter sp. SP1R1]|uniref:SMP-30/gluconolactonase/LRE family protein n=1 Tax=Mucilaginibacter sp. SP1R1 TaxID=2723091 RepID=UPI0016136DB4|nr:SMP-30/gluconolactonase/LRE family protein [Mucilaginibacter sp. SP1R1]MBB6151115.1 sugar lactone lactonase YvrE [Mucilaginibacter sp. SP1R1]
MQIWNAEILYKTDLILGEGAYWHVGWKKFLYVDIEGQKVGCINPITKEIEEKNVGKRVGTVIPATNGKLIVALQGSIEELDFETGELTNLVSIEADKPDNRSNDGKCDAAGRLWIGTMHVDAKLHEGALYLFDGEVRKMLSSTSVSNGICWSADNRVMYYIDSFDYNVKAYDFDLESGNISNERIIVKIEEPGYTPDGMCIDGQGMLWVAIWGGYCVNRYDPATGNLIGKVTVDAPNVTNCAFGGDDMSQLFITTAKSGLSDEQLQQYPLSGALFCVNTGIPGSTLTPFTVNR